METVENSTNQGSSITDVTYQGIFLYCSNCHMCFEDDTQHREHCRTDWHFYNLKRKIVGLPHVTND